MPIICVPEESTCVLAHPERVKNSPATNRFGMVVRYISAASTGPGLETHETIALTELDPLGPSIWKPLALPARLGVGLACCLDEDPIDLKATTARHALLAVLVTDYDPTSATFGKPAYDFCGTVVFKWQPAISASDQLSSFTLLALERFIRISIASMRGMLAEGNRGAATGLYEMMRPMQFKKFFKRHFAEQVKKGQVQKPSGKEMCPVVVGYEHCECCGRMSTERAERKRCGRCMKVAYCSKDCQINDWDAHRYFCSKAELQDKPKCDETGLRSDARMRA